MGIDVLLSFTVDGCEIHLAPPDGHPGMIRFPNVNTNNRDGFNPGFISWCGLWNFAPIHSISSTLSIGLEEKTGCPSKPSKARSLTGEDVRVHLQLGDLHVAVGALVHLRLHLTIRLGEHQCDMLVPKASVIESDRIVIQRC